jgi:hypothetical protein
MKQQDAHEMEWSCYQNMCSIFLIHEAKKTIHSELLQDALLLMRHWNYILTVGQLQNTEMLQQKNLIQEETPLRREVANNSCKNKTPFLKVMEAIDIPLYCGLSLLHY